MIYEVSMWVHENGSSTSRGHAICYCQDMTYALMVKMALEKVNQPYLASSQGDKTISYRIEFNISPYHGDLKSDVN
jgi:hypothetical protein